MRLPKTAHTSQPWRVHDFTKDFEIEDVWELPTPGGPDDLARLVRQFASTPEDSKFFSGAFGALFALRWKLGELFGWDKPGSGVGERVRSLRERLPADLLEAPRGPDLEGVPVPFTSVYQTHDEWVAEMANMTCHAAMHIGWVPDASGSGYHAQMAVLVKPNGWFGKVYWPRSSRSGACSFTRRCCEGSDASGRCRQPDDLRRELPIAPRRRNEARSTRDCCRSAPAWR